MAATPYSPVSFFGEAVSQQKMQKLTNNQQWLFENMPRVRYTSPGRTTDSGTKVITGKIAYGTTPGDALDAWVYFGNFFTAGCSPVVTTTVQTHGGHLRKFTTIRSMNGLQIDHTGFVAHLSTHERSWVPQNVEAGGYIHWMAVGY